MTTSTTLTINRAPVLTLWATVVAERLGFDRDEALTLGRAVAGLNAYAKGVSLGLFQPRPKEVERSRKAAPHGQVLHVDLLRRAVPAVRTPDGVRALVKDKPISPDSTRRYLETKFGEQLDAARDAMTELARRYSAEELAEQGYSLYEEFRPAIPAGARGWGAAGRLDLEKIRGLAKR